MNSWCFQVHQSEMNGFAMLSEGFEDWLKQDNEVSPNVCRCVWGKWNLNPDLPLMRKWGAANIVQSCCTSVEFQQHMIWLADLAVILQYWDSSPQAIYMCIFTHLYLYAFTYLLITLHIPIYWSPASNFNDLMLNAFSRISSRFLSHN